MSSKDKENVNNMPPSVKLIVKTLQHEAPLTQQELSQSTLLPSRTVRYALNRLKETNAIDVKPNPQDARQNIYSLSDYLGSTTEQSADSIEQASTEEQSRDSQSDDQQTVTSTNVLEQIETEFEGLES